MHFLTENGSLKKAQYFKSALEARTFTTLITIDGEM